MFVCLRSRCHGAAAVEAGAGRRSGRARWGAWAAAPLLMAAAMAAPPLWAETPAASPGGAEQSEKEKPAEEEPAEEIVVTGTRLRTGSFIVPADVRLVGSERLARPGVRSAPEALNDLSGVKLNPRQENALFSDIEVRGLTGNATSGSNVLVLLDGVPQRRLSFGGPYLGALPYEAISRMELVKGASASLYGRNALAGTLQLFSGAGSDEPQHGLSLGYGGGDGARTSLRSSGPLGAGGGGRPSHGTYALAGSYSRGGGWQPRTGRRCGDIYLHTDLSLSAGETLSLFGGFVDGREEMASPVFVDRNGSLLPGFERDTNIAVEGHNNLELREMRLGARYSRDWSDRLRGKLTLAYWDADTHWDVGRPDDRPATGTIAARPTDRRDFAENSVFTELEMTGQYRLGERWKAEVSAGASYDYLTYDMSKTDITTQNLFNATGKYTTGIPFDLATMQTADLSPWVYSAPSRRDTFEYNAGVFVRQQLTLLDRLHVSGGVRYDWFERTQVNPDTAEKARLRDSAFSPSVGLNLALVSSPAHKLSLYGNYGLGFSPVFRAVNNTQFANVKPEESVSEEIGLKALLWKRRVEGSVAFYRLDRRDIVAMNPATKLQENAGDWRIQGVETDWRARLAEDVALFASAAWRSPRIRRYAADPSLEGNRIPGVSRQAWAVGIEGHGKRGLGGGIQARYASSFFGNERNSFRLPGRTVCDAWVSYDWDPSTRVSAYVRNLFDAVYYTAVFNGVANGSAFAGAPRTLGLTLARTF